MKQKDHNEVPKTKQKSIQTTEQQNVEETSAQTDGFRYDYDDSSDVD
ncbi:hypothetical protein [Anaerobacillus alkaliphilus]|nr:hypothetical protein [Anaerobacillus alkaliphilus]